MDYTVIISAIVLGPGIGRSVALPLQAGKAVGNLFHRGPLPLRDRIGLLRETLDRLLARKTRCLRVFVEPRHHATQLVDRAADPLPVLLCEFGSLGGDQAGQEADP